jgi:uroporphyrinogen-III synthase
MLRIEPLETPIPPGRYQAVVSTSANGVRALTGRPELAALLDLPFLAVGPATAAAARDAGFRRVRMAEGDAAALGRLAAACLEPGSGPILYAAAQNRAGRLDAALRDAGFAVVTTVLYRAEAVADLSAGAAAALREGRIQGVLVYSARTAETFAACVRRAGLAENLRRVTAFAISPAAAAPLRDLGFARIEVADRPDGDRVLALVPGVAAEPLA